MSGEGCGQNGCCIALINNRSLAKEIIDAVKEEWEITSECKNENWLDKIVTEDWCGFLLGRK